MARTSSPTFGIWYDFRSYPPRAADWPKLYATYLDEIADAEALGFSEIWLSEHHFVDDGYLPSQFLVLAALAQRTKSMRLGTSVLLMPLFHPLHVAEDGAVLDLLSGGRFDFGVGVGYVQHEFEAFGVPRTQRGSRTEEAVQIIRQAWEDGVVNFKGRHWSYEGLVVEPRPAQKPRPPIYFGGSHPAAIDRAVRLGDGYIGGPAAAEQIRAALDRHGRDPSTFAHIVTTSVYLHPDPKQAWNDVAPGIAYQANRYREWGTDREKPRPAPVRPEDLNPANYLVGEPDAIAERIVALYRKTPFDQLAFWGHLPGLSTEQARRSHRLFAERVRPAVLRAIGRIDRRA